MDYRIPPTIEEMRRKIDWIEGELALRDARMKRADGEVEYMPEYRAYTELCHRVMIAERILQGMPLTHIVKTA